MTILEPSADAGSHPAALPGAERRLGPAPVGRAEKIALAVGFVGLAVAVIGTRWGVFTPDTRPDLYHQPGRFLGASLDAWVPGPTGLGQSNFNAGAAPVALVIWAIRTLGAPAWLAVRIWRLLLLVVAAWGIRRYLAATVGDGLSASARLLVTVFWVANPYVIVAGNTTPILLPYALLPWTMLAFLHATRRGGWRWPAVFALAFFAQTGLNAGVVPFFQLLALPAHLIFVRVTEGRSWRSLFGAVLRCAVLAVVVSLYWLAPSMLASGTGAAIASSTEAPRDVARTSSYSEVARGLGQWPLYGRAGDRYFLGGYTVYLTNRVVLWTTLTVTAALGVALWRSRSRARVLAMGLLATGLPVMVGMFPGVQPYPIGRVMDRVFNAVPATMAFRTTNKIGAVAVLGMALALALLARIVHGRLRHESRVLRWSAAAMAALIIAGISTPLWNGSLYPLGSDIPDRWRQVTRDLDAAGDGPVLVVPGGTGGNYRWGMRSPDDLFPSHLKRPVISRNTVVGAADPTGNFLTWFDTGLQYGTLPEGAVSTTARYLGADTVLDRRDVLSEETVGADPSVIAAQTVADPGLTSLQTYGAPGTDTVPGAAGPASKLVRDQHPDDAALAPIETFRVADPIEPVRTAAAADLVLVDGDGAAFAPMVDVGIVDGRQPVRYLGDLDLKDLRGAVDQGARIVLTDTNQRRGWDINRLLDASTPVLSAGQSFDLGNGPSITLWPDHLDRQTVATFGTTIASVTSEIDTFGVRPAEKPAFAVDGDGSTTWWTGGIIDPTGARLVITLAKPTKVTSLSVAVASSSPSRIEELTVEAAGQVSVIETPMTGAYDVPLIPAVTDRIVLTLSKVSPGNNQVGISELAIDGGKIAVSDRLRTPRTVMSLLDGLPRDQTDDLLAETPIDVLLTRLRGRDARADDDEERALRRDIVVPATRSFELTGRLSSADISRDVVDAARSGDVDCADMLLVDGVPVSARISSVAGTGPDTVIDIEGCGAVELVAGSHRIDPAFGFTIDQLRLSSDPEATVASDGDRNAPVVIEKRDATRIEMTVPQSDGPRYLRLGVAYDPRWRLEVDGRDQGAPIVVDGYSSGWLLDGSAHRVVATFPPQAAVRSTFVASTLGLAGVVAIAVLPGRRPDEDERNDDGDPSDPTDGGDPDGDSTAEVER